jgi:hypothetical protein
MPAMKSLTFGVGGAALASAISFIYAQAASDGLSLMPPPLIPHFVPASPQRPLALGQPPSGESRVTMGPSSAPAATSAMNRRERTGPPQPASR